MIQRIQTPGLVASTTGFCCFFKYSLDANPAKPAAALFSV